MSDFEPDIEYCLKVLDQGGIILYPTDTVWGLGCDATNPAAVVKIFELKARPDAKSMIVLVGEEKDILKYVASVDMSLFNYLENTTKPTTVIYDGAISLAENVVAADGSVAIRIVRDKFCRHLIKRFRKPIVSTSANISGDPTPAKYTEITNPIRIGVDYIVNYRQDDEQEYESSSIIKWNRDGSATILRQ